MLIIKKGETGTKSTTANVDTEIVECSHTTVHKSLTEDARYQLNWALFFGNMSEAQILEAAAEHFIIKIRRSFSKCDKPKNDDWNNVQFDCSKYISTRQTKVDKLTAALADFSDEQLAALGLTRSEKEEA